MEKGRILIASLKSFYAVVKGLNSHAALDVLYEDQHPVNKHLNTASNTQIYTNTHYAVKNILTAQLIRKATFPVYFQIVHSHV